jgi:hypothetical protein
LFNLNLDRNNIATVLDRTWQTVGSEVHLPWALDCLVMHRT